MVAIEGWQLASFTCFFHDVATSTFSFNPIDCILLQFQQFDAIWLSLSKLCFSHSAMLFSPFVTMPLHLCSTWLNALSFSLWQSVDSWPCPSHCPLLSRAITLTLPSCWGMVDQQMQSPFHTPLIS